MNILLFPLILWILAYWFKFYVEMRVSKSTSLTWRQYEYKVAKHMKRRWFKQIVLWRGTKDWWYDIWAIKSNELWIAQCKRYGWKRKVGVKEVRELFGVAQSKNAKAIFYCTNGFTIEAIKFSSSNKIRRQILK